MKLSKRYSNVLRTAGIAAAVLFLANCNYGGSLSGIHWFLDMHDGYSVESQEEDYTNLDVSKNGAWTRGMDNSEIWGGPGTVVRMPPEGTIPRNKEPYPYEATDFAAAGAELRNPLPATKAILARGQDQYNAYCAVCHGYTGNGDGPVTPRFPDVPSLNSEKIKAWKDGEIFHIITMGRARMYPYAAQVEPNDRWAIIRYVRLLQANSEQ